MILGIFIVACSFTVDSSTFIFFILNFLIALMQFNYNYNQAVFASKLKGNKRIKIFLFWFSYFPQGENKCNNSVSFGNCNYLNLFLNSVQYRLLS